MEGKTKMVDDLDAILAYLAKLKRPVANLLQDGITVPELRLKTALLPMKLPREVIELYGWRNGTRYSKGDSLDNLHLWPGFYFLPVEKAMVHYLTLRDAPGWRPNWFPLFGNGGGDFYATVCGEAETNATPLVGYIMGAEVQDVEYESLAAMIATVRACFERGAFFLSKYGHLEANDVFHAKIAKEFNPSVVLWKVKGDTHSTFPEAER